MSINILKLYIIYFFIFSIDCYILIPLKIYNNTIIHEIITSNNLNEDNLSLILYSQLSLGEPKQNIFFIISPEEYNFCLVTDKNNNGNNSNYDFRLSKTNYLEIDENNINRKFLYMSEKFYFMGTLPNENFIKEIGVENINLALFFQYPNFLKNYNLSLNINSYIIFGLKLTEAFSKVEYSLNLIRQLKIKNITKNYKWFIDYNSNVNNKILTYTSYFDEIQMIIGAEPHKIYPNKYKEKNLKLINAKSRNEYVNWGFYFNKIFCYQNNKDKNQILFELNNNVNINNTNLEEYLISDIKHDLIFIKSPKIFLDFINKYFFNELFQEGLCFLDEKKYNYIYCENRPEIEEYIQNNFKDIYFRNQELNYEFNFGYQDLFVKYEDKIIFLIISQKEFKRWTLGIPFLKKNLLIYDYDHKVIGFYKSTNEKFIIKKNFGNSIIKIIIIFLLLLIFGFFGFLISQHLYGYNRKKRLNELQENLNYIEHFNIKENESSNNLNKKEKKEKLIELKIEKI